jgi:hypothetical protein
MKGGNVYIVFKDELAVQELIKKHPKRENDILGIAHVFVFTGVWDPDNQDKNKDNIIRELGL